MRGKRKTKREKEKADRRVRRKEKKSEERRESSRGCGLPVTDSASDNAFIMGKGEQRKGLIHRCVRER